MEYTTPMKRVPALVLWLVFPLALATAALLYVAAVYQVPYAAVAAGVILFSNSVYMVRPQEAFIIERLGNFARASTGGIRLKLPFVENIVGVVTLKVLRLADQIESISKDKTSVHVHTVLQYYVEPDTRRNGAIYNAFYRLSDFQTQLKDWLFDSVRSVAPEHDFDDLFLKKDDLAEGVNQRLGPDLGKFGFKIEKTNIVGIEPKDPEVLAQMARINMAVRETKIAEQEGEAKRIRMAKDGEGMGAIRKGAMTGLKEGLDGFGELSETERARIFDLVELGIVADASEKMAATANTKVVFFPAIGSRIAQEMRNAQLQANEANNTPEPARTAS